MEAPARVGPQLGLGASAAGEAGEEEPERPLAMLFSEYPELAQVRGIGAKLDAWRANPELARAYAEEAVREGWPDVGAAEAGGRSAVALPETAIGAVLRQGASSGVRPHSSPAQGELKDSPDPKRAATATAR